MLSLRAKLFLGMIRYGQKRNVKKGRDLIFNQDTSIDAFRESVNRTPKMFGRVPKEWILREEIIHGVSGEWILPKGDSSERMILYFHGGGYVSGDYEHHRMHVAKVVKASGVKAYVFNYRLAPEHPHPAALEDAVEVYKGLLEKGHQPSEIIFMGDSAGGGLSIAVLLALKERELSLPAALVALSPWLDLACKEPSYVYNAASCLSPQNSWNVFSEHYCGDANPKSPLISPIYGQLEGIPPLLLFVGSCEVMVDEVKLFSKKAIQAGVEVDLEVGEGLFHCYPICGSFFPEARNAMDKIGRFINEKYAYSTKTSPL